MIKKNSRAYYVDSDLVGVVVNNIPNSNFDMLVSDDGEDHLCKSAWGDLGCDENTLDGMEEHYMTRLLEAMTKGFEAYMANEVQPQVDGYSNRGNPFDTYFNKAMFDAWNAGYKQAMSSHKYIREQTKILGTKSDDDCRGD